MLTPACPRLLRDAYGTTNGCWIGLLGERSSATGKLGALQTRQNQLQRVARSSTRRLMLPAESRTKLLVSCWETFGYGRLATRVQVYQAEFDMVFQHQQSPLSRGQGEDAGYWTASGSVVLDLLAVGTGHGAGHPAGYAISGMWLRFSQHKSWMRNVRRRLHQVRLFPFELYNLLCFIWRCLTNEGVAIFLWGFKRLCVIAGGISVFVLLLWVIYRTWLASESVKLWAGAACAVLPTNPAVFLVDYSIASAENVQNAIIRFFAPHAWHLWGFMLLVHSALWFATLDRLKALREAVCAILFSARPFDGMKKVWSTAVKTLQANTAGVARAAAYFSAYPLVCNGYAVTAVAVPTIGWRLHGGSFMVLLSEEYQHAMIILLVFSGFVAEVGTGTADNMPLLFGRTVFELFFGVLTSSLGVSSVSLLLSIVPAFINFTLGIIEKRQKRKERRQVGIKGQTLRRASELCWNMAKIAFQVSGLTVGGLLTYELGCALSNGGLRSIIPPAAFVLAMLDMICIYLPCHHPRRRLPTVAICALSVLTACGCSSMARPMTYWDDLTCSLLPEEAPPFLTPRHLFRFSEQLFQFVVVAFSVVSLAYYAYRTVMRFKRTKDATPAARGKDRNRKAAQNRHQPAEEPAPSTRPAAELGLSADPSTTSRAIVLHASAVASGKKDRVRPSVLRRPKVELIPSDLAAEQGKAAVLVTWSEATGARARRS